VEDTKVLLSTACDDYTLENRYDNDDTEDNAEEEELESVYDISARCQPDNIC